MPRSQRIQFEDALYHVMNRGRGRQTIFHSEDYFHLFLKSVEEAQNRFGLEVIAYYLMENHYHLFVKTPRSNLDRCMRHINSVYTQHYWHKSYYNYLNYAIKHWSSRRVSPNKLNNK